VPTRLAIVALAALSVTALSAASGELPPGEVLYNGIRLPTPWPPRVAELPAEPAPVPYLVSPPAVIPIDVGRQLFVDDFLIESTTLKRTFHSAEYYKENPVLRPDKPWEQTGRDPCAMVFSDGAWYDPQDRLFKMWYMGGYVASTCYATSRDGVRWEKPALDVKPGTNVVMTGWRDSSTVWLDLDEKDPARRYKMFRVGTDAGWRVLVYFSADGIHWGEPAGRSPPTGDRTTVFWNPFRKVWVYGLRANSKLGRSRQYVESPDALAGANWKPGEPVWWTAADRLDKPRDDLKTQPQLYNLDAAAYESLMVGLFAIWRGQPADRPKPNEVLIGFSRDGFHWDRTNRRPFIPVSENKGDWNWGNVQSCGGGCLVVGDTLYFYVSGRRGVAGTSSSGECATGLATLRRDGFASMDAAGSAGTLTTRPVRFTGRHLFVNVAAGGGELRAEALDESGREVEPFTAANCQPLRGDATRAAVRWTGAEDLAPLAGKPVRFRFLLTAGRLYSFWVSPEKAGASRGYVAGGGPGFTGPTDTVGEAALKTPGGP
jgi:hypothetical protein